jgi:hypothetical protein
MELKNALTVCLISFFSATLVLLIARALDLQAASKLEPKLDEIAKELRTIREGGGMAVGGTGSPAAAKDGLAVYYAHGNTRCPTCRTIESHSHEAVTSGFAEELRSGKVKWEIVNYETSGGKRFITDYEVQMPVVVLVEMKDGNPGKWKRLDEVWGLVGDKDGFIEYVQKEIRAMLGTEAAEPKVAETLSQPSWDSPVMIVPPVDEKTESPPLPDLPLP